MRFLATSFCALAMLPALSGAQEPVKSSPKGPTLQAASVAFRVEPSKVDAFTKLTAAPMRPHAGQDVARWPEEKGLGTGASMTGISKDAKLVTFIDGSRQDVYTGR